MLVVMTISSIFLSVAAAQWAYIVRREKERELIFRGVQIARAVDEWQQDPAHPAPPMDLELLTKPPRPVLRRVPADPMTAKYDDDGKLIEGTGEWTYIDPGGEAAGSGGTGASTASGPSGPSGAGSSPTGPSASVGGRRSGSGFGATPQMTPIIGVQSKSDELAIGSYQGSAPETPYSEWKSRGFGVTRNLNLVQGYEIPRPPGFAGFRLPGGPPLQDLDSNQNGGAQPPGEPPRGTGRPPR